MGSTVVGWLICSSLDLFCNVLTGFARRAKSTLLDRPSEYISVWPVCSHERRVEPPSLPVTIAASSDRLYKCQNTPHAKVEKLLIGGDCSCMYCTCT